MKTYETFIFEDFRFDPDTGALSLRYSLDEELYFEEQWNFPISPPSPLLNQEEESLAAFKNQLQSAIQGLWIMCGISYYKAHLPKNILIKNIVLSKSQAVFFDKIYLHGLGEFFYENKIDPRGLINFPYEKKERNVEDNSFSPSVSQSLNLSGTLIPVGGGKDSLTTIELIKKSENLEILPLSTWAVGHGDMFGPMLEKIDLPHLQVTRKICPNLITENKKGGLNGHIPISSILAFSSVVTALLNGKKYIPLSNESSANEANVEMYGMEINHQYSKTLEFEQNFQGYVKENISEEVEYFSFLRPLKEIHIAQIFCSICFDTYRDCFSSCNRNFKIESSTTDRNMRWCGQCSKCAFVACIFAPFLDRKQMHNLFGCEIFKQKEILKFVPELLGQTEHKPFECVGEYDEVQYGINAAVDSENWPELECFKNTINLDLALNNHSMPELFYTILNNSMD